MTEKFGFRIQPTVFFTSAALIIGFVVVTALYPGPVGDFFAANQEVVTGYLGWFYILSVTGLLGFVVWLAASPYGRIKLGKDDDVPEFSRFGWFAMLFSAGMGIGLLYNGVAEPLAHYVDPPRAEPETIAAAEEAMRFTFYHWGFHPWAVYSVVGLCIGYFSFRHDMPLSLRSAFYPLLGDRVHGPIGHAIDIFAVVGTMFGVAASLAIGAKQINAGLSEVFGVPSGITAQLMVIAFITLVATLSVVSGLDKGIKRLSQANLILSGCLLVFLFMFGNTIFMLDAFVYNFGHYLQIVTETSFWTDPHNEAADWQASWTLAYWGWWLAWAPFVGMFVARVSKGRTIREFVLAVLIVPTVVSFFWFTIAGDSAIQMARAGNAALIETINQENGLDVIFFVFLQSFPFAQVTSVLLVVAVFVFFVTSSDSGSLVIDMLTSGGQPHPPTAQRVFWATTEGFVGAILILAGGLAATRSAVATAGLPIAVMEILMCVALVKALRQERHGLFARRMQQAEKYVEEHGEGVPAPVP